MKIDRISRLPRLIATICAKGARLAVPGVVDLSKVATDENGVSKIVLESVQDMLLKLALQMACDDYEDRHERQRQGIELATQAGRYSGRKADKAVISVPTEQQNSLPITASAIIQMLHSCPKSAVT